MDTRSLECFVTVARAGGMRPAAKLLNITQPALTTRIRRLEDEIGFALFERRGRGLSLSERGRLFLPRAAKAVEAMAETRVSADLIAEGREGPLRFGYTPIAALSVVPPLLRAFKAARPMVRIEPHEMTSHPVERAIVEGDLDAGVLHPPVSEQGLRLEVFGAYGFKVVLPSSHRLAGRKRLRFAELAEEDFVMVARRIGPGIFDRIVGCCLAAGFQPRILQETNTSVSLLGMVAAGMGVGLVIAPLTRFSHPGIAIVDLAEAGPTLGFALACAAEADNPLAEALINVVADARAEMPPFEPA